MKILPIPMLEILPIAVMAAALSGCHATTAVEASSTRHPVVAPAGSVLRVRLNQSLVTGRSRPGDRFSGVLDSALYCGSAVVLPKGTTVEGRVVVAKESARAGQQAVLAVTLDDYLVKDANGAKRYPIAAGVVTRTASPADRNVALEADSIVGFTLNGILGIQVQNERIKGS
jgi:hypothetical protein